MRRNRENVVVSDGRQDFDFLHGRWRIRNRRLAKRLQGCTDWQEFEAAGECRSILGGIGNVDSFDAIFPDGKPISGMSLRIFDPATREWSIYWADDRICALLPPVTGRFENGIGTFRGDDELDGRPVKVVFRWYDLTPASATWEQAFSDDDGATWELNWQMLFTRTSE
jgi:hypothetical protein